MSEVAKRLGVIVSPHATMRLLERFPELEGRDLTALIFAEVSRALEEGRKAQRKPSWAAWAYRTKYVDTRYVWNPEKTRAYVIGKMRARAKESNGIDRRNDEFGDTWVVRTVLPAYAAQDEDFGHAQRWRHEEHKRFRKRRGREPRGRKT